MTFARVSLAAAVQMKLGPIVVPVHVVVNRGDEFDDVPKDAVPQAMLREIAKRCGVKA